METGVILENVRKLCQEKQYADAQHLIDTQKEALDEKFPLAQQYIEIKQGSLLTRMKLFFKTN